MSKQIWLPIDPKQILVLMSAYARTDSEGETGPGEEECHLFL